MSEEHTGKTQSAAVTAAWERVEKARHPQRPYPMDLIDRIFTDFSEIHGDRRFGDDEAVACGMARLSTPASKDRSPGTPDLDGAEVLVIGIRKGGTTKEKIRRNFGMPNPEGYRKALRAMKLAEKFNRPVIAIVDVAGAYPGVGAEERGQGEAIARNLLEMARLKVPTISVITGEGGSGGALALAVADRVLILETAVYSVISPEGAAAIAWRDGNQRQVAAEALKITALEVSGLGCVDAVIAEPEGGILDNPDAAAALLGDALYKHLAELKALSLDELLAARHKKLRNLAQFYTESGTAGSEAAGA